MSAMNSTVPALDLNALSHVAAAYLAPLQPYNPQPVFKHYWEQMTDNYTEYQIATYGSLSVQVFFYFATALPGFIFQFLAFMKQYKVQKNKQHTLAEQWICLKRVCMSKSCIYVREILTTSGRLLEDEAEESQHGKLRQD
jgi:methylsterol monooxygenase